MSTADESRVLESLDGYDVPRLVARAGQSPCYVYLRSVITRQVARLRAALPVGSKLYYSPKANPMPAVIQHFAPLVDGFDVASHGEMQRVLDTGIEPARCVFTGPGKGIDEIRAAVASGVVINIESAAQLEQVAVAGKEFKLRPTVMLRLNASFSPSRNHMRDHMSNQFGVDVAEAPALLTRMRALELAFRGFHVFWGSQHHEPQAVAEAQRQAYLLARSVAEHAPTPVESVSVGGGFPVPFFADEQAFDLEAAGTAIRRWAEPAMRADRCVVAFEFGRFLIGPAGYYVCRVLDRKRIGAETFLVVDGGLHHHLLASGTFGQAGHRNFRVWSAKASHASPIEEVTVVGRLCSSMDRIATGVSLPRAEPRDYLVLPNSGAYGASFSARDFLSHPPAAEILV